MNVRDNLYSLLSTWLLYFFRAFHFRQNAPLKHLSLPLSLSIPIRFVAISHSLFLQSAVSFFFSLYLSHSLPLSLFPDLILLHLIWSLHRSWRKKVRVLAQVSPASLKCQETISYPNTLTYPGPILQNFTPFYVHVTINKRLCFDSKVFIPLNYKVITTVHIWRIGHAKLKQLQLKSN